MMSVSVYINLAMLGKGLIIECVEKFCGIYWAEKIWVIDDWKEWELMEI